MIGIIGGTGLYSIEGLKIVENREVETPFGSPSAPIALGELRGRRIAFLPRHGIHHQILPSEINFRANIWALKAVGARRLISVSATGSLEREIEPGDLAVPSQYFDWTRGTRARTFFGGGMVAHISTAEPSCPGLTARIGAAAQALRFKLHTGKTYACVEGPRLGTRAESFFLQAAGCHLVGMTNVPEAFLAREAQLCYCTIAVPTDYDCWLDDPAQHVTVDKVIELYKKTLGKVQQLLLEMLSTDGAFAPCACQRSLEGALMTPESQISEENRAVLRFLRS